MIEINVHNAADFQASIDAITKGWAKQIANFRFPPPSPPSVSHRLHIHPVVSIYGLIRTVDEFQSLCRVVDSIEMAPPGDAVEKIAESYREQSPLDVRPQANIRFAKPVKVMKKKAWSLGLGAQVTSSVDQSIRRGFPALKISPAVHVFLKIHYPGLL